MSECKGLPYIVLIVLFSFINNVTKFFELDTVQVLSDSPAGKIRYIRCTPVFDNVVCVLFYPYLPRA